MVNYRINLCLKIKPVQRLRPRYRLFVYGKDRSGCIDKQLCDMLSFTGIRLRKKISENVLHFLIMLRVNTMNAENAYFFT